MQQNEKKDILTINLMNLLIIWNIFFTKDFFIGIFDSMLIKYGAVMVVYTV